MSWANIILKFLPIINHDYTMGQKEISYRIAMSMLMQCAAVWELATACHTEGDFRYTLQDVLKGMEANKKGCKRKKNITVGLMNIRYLKLNVLAERIKAIPCVTGLNESLVSLFVGTSATDLKQGFSCSYPLFDVFTMCYSFCRKQGFHTLLKEAVFGRDADGFYSILPEWKIPKERAPVRKPVAAKPSAKVAVTRIKIDPRAVLEAARELAKKRKIA